MIRHKKKHTLLKIVLAILTVLILAVGALLYWQRDAFLYAIQPEQITLKDTNTVKQAILEGPYLNITTPVPETIRYQTEDEAFTFSTVFEGGEVKSVSGQIDITKTQPMDIQSGLALGETLLSPYLTKEEITAIEALLMSDILQLAASTTIDYSRQIGDMTLTVQGSIDKNDLRFTLESLANNR